MVAATNGSAPAGSPAVTRYQRPMGSSTVADAAVASQRKTTGSAPRLAMAFHAACKPAAHTTRISAARLTRGSVSQLGQTLREGRHDGLHVLGGERAHVGDAEGVGADLTLPRVDDVAAPLHRVVQGVVAEAGLEPEGREDLRTP